MLTPGSSRWPRACVAALFLSACYTPTGSRLKENDTLESLRTLDVGTEYRVDVHPDDSRLGIQAQAVPLCRAAETGTTSRERVEISERSSALPNTSFVLITLGSLAAITGLAVGAAGGNSNSDAVTALELGGVGLGVLGIAGAITYGLLPNQKESSTPVPPKHFNRWASDVKPCRDRAPQPAAGLPVRVVARYAGVKDGFGWKGATDADGRWSFDDVASLRVPQAWCGAAKVVIESLPPNPHEDSGTPEHPEKIIRPAAPAELKLAAPEQPLIALVRDADVAAAARSCCLSKYTPAHAEECELTCAKEGHVVDCVYARRGCVIKADASREPALGKRLCETYFEGCLVKNDTSTANLHKCVQLCSNRRAEETCR